MKKYLVGLACAATLAACGGSSERPELSAFPAGGAQGKVVVRNVSTTDIAIMTFEPVVNGKLADYYVRPQPQSVPAGTSATYRVPAGVYSVSGGKGFKFLIGPRTITVGQGQNVTLTSKK